MLTPAMEAAIIGPMYFLRENGTAWRLLVSFAPLDFSGLKVNHGDIRASYVR